MASKVMMASSTSPSNPDLPRQSFIHHSLSSLSDHSNKHNLSSSMNMDDLLKNIYDEPEPFAGDNNSNNNNIASERVNKSVDEVWKEIVAGEDQIQNLEPEMTLEDFLRKAGAVREDDVRLQNIPAVIPEYSGVDPIVAGGGAPYQGVPHHMQSSLDSPAFGNAAVVVPVGTTTGGRGKRRAVVDEPPVDKATQQKQRRMIKNRESAARSRERKQAYTVELESLVTQLEEENARLLREEAELAKERIKQLMEILVPVVEKRRPPRVLRRTNSM